MGNPKRAVKSSHQMKGASSLPWVLAGIGVLVCLTAFTLASLHADPASGSQVAGHSNGANPSGTPKAEFPGVPAITPHLNLAANAASVASGGTATQPTFTADDASAWVTAHLLPSYQTTGKATIGSVTFVPQEEANQWQDLGLALGLPAGTPVCIVVLDGTFTHNRQLGAPAGSSSSLTYSYLILGFNGLTGNFMDKGWTNSLPAALAAPAAPGTSTSTPSN
jgi:hypothetical protein